MAVQLIFPQPCFCSDLLRAQTTEGFSDDAAGYIAGSLLEAGSETTASILYGFVQALLVWPEVQKKAQEEIDRVVGDERLPEMEDYAQMPYIRCCIKESLRWMPVVILGVPHAVIKDDVYNGYAIPKGAKVVNNVWYEHPSSWVLVETMLIFRNQGNPYGSKAFTRPTPF